MSNLLRERQILHARLARIDFPRMQVKNRRPADVVYFADAVLRVRVREQSEVTAAAERKATSKHFDNAHRKLIQAVSNLVRNERRVGDAVIRMKADRKH